MSRVLNARVILSSLALLSFKAYAENQSVPYYTVEGTQTTVIPINTEGNLSQSSHLSADTLAGVKTIQLLKIRASSRLITQLAKNRDDPAKTNELDYTKGIVDFSKSPGAVDLGMENVPVLDQGSQGTCVTFSSTAALDARLKLGDYIDQQCTLALTTALGSNYWDGANAPSDLYVPLKKYGIVQKGKCSGANYPDVSQKITIAQYEKISNKSYAADINYKYAEAVPTSVDAIKTALKAGHRVVIGTYLADDGDFISVGGFDVTINNKHDRGGLWACQQTGNTKNYCPPQDQLSAGHEIVVIGYDDKQQLLKIRNSWNTVVGDSGDYYMTYTFFKSMGIDYTVVL